MAGQLDLNNSQESRKNLQGSYFGFTFKETMTNEQRETLKSSESIEMEKTLEEKEMIQGVTYQSQQTS